MPPLLPSFWSLPAEQVLHQLKSGSQGLSRQEAEQRLIQWGKQPEAKAAVTHLTPATEPV